MFSNNPTANRYYYSYQPIIFARSVPRSFMPSTYIKLLLGLNGNSDAVLTVFYWFLMNNRFFFIIIAETIENKVLIVKNYTPK